MSVLSTVLIGKNATLKRPNPEKFGLENILPGSLDATEAAQMVFFRNPKISRNYPPHHHHHHPSILGGKVNGRNEFLEIKKLKSIDDDHLSLLFYQFFILPLQHPCIGGAK